jgi:cytoskeletal protein CcmA (bactofilin family)
MAFFAKDGTTGDPRPTGAEAILSIIAAGMRITGDLEGPGLLKIDGAVDGSITGARQVIVGREGSVHGNVHATEAIVAGSVEGAIVATERVEIQGSAVVDGDIHTRVIVVHEGARINGAVRMGVAAGELADRPAVQVMR